MNLVHLLRRGKKKFCLANNFQPTPSCQHRPFFLSLRQFQALPPTPPTSQVNFDPVASSTSPADLNSTSPVDSAPPSNPRSFRRLMRYFLLGGLGVATGLFYYFFLDNHNKILAEEQEIQEEIDAIKQHIKDYREIVEKLAHDNERIHGLNFQFRLFLRYLQISLLLVPALSLFYVNQFIESVPITRFLWSYLAFSAQTLGGLWIKVAQWASTRPDLFTEDSIDRIRHLVDHCPEHSLRDTERVFKAQFGVPMGELFDEFDSVPIASGAIAQVYKGVYKGEKVAVKVLHPGILSCIEIDLHIMSTVIDQLGRISPNTQALGLDEALNQFEETMKSQTNLRIEGENLKIFAKNFKETPNVMFPEFRAATNDVLIETFCHGVSMKHYLGQNHPYEERKYMAALGLRAFLKMIILDNFVHADLHSGNILVNYDRLPKNVDDSPNIMILDVGLTTFANEDDLDLIKELFQAVGTHNPEGGARILMRYSEKSMPKADQEDFLKEMSHFFSVMYNTDPREYNATKGLSEMLDIQRKFKVKHPGNLTTLLIGMIVLEGIGKQLYTDETRIFDDALGMIVRKRTQENVLVRNYNAMKKQYQAWREAREAREVRVC